MKTLEIPSARPFAFTPDDLTESLDTLAPPLDAAPDPAPQAESAALPALGRQIAEEAERQNLVESPLGNPITPGIFANLPARVRDLPSVVIERPRDGFD